MLCNIFHIHIMIQPTGKLQTHILPLWQHSTSHPVICSGVCLLISWPFSSHPFVTPKEQFSCGVSFLHELKLWFIRFKLALNTKECLPSPWAVHFHPLPVGTVLSLSVSHPSPHMHSPPKKKTHTGSAWVGGGVCVGKLGTLTCVTVSHHQRAVLIPPLSYAGFLSYFVVNIFNNWPVLPSNPSLLAFPYFA